MPQFQFTAADAKGEQMSGTVESTSEADANQQLRSQGYYPLQVVEVGKGKLAAKKAAKKVKAAGPKKAKSSTGGRIKPKILMIFTRQLATLIDSGLPLLRGLTVLAKQEPNPVLRGTIGALADSVQGGSTFSEALAQHPRIFNKLYVNMVKAGELGGVLEVVLVRLAEYQEKAHKLKNKIVSAMVYPIIVMFIAVAILVFLMLFIVPKFETMFAEMGNDAELPMISQIVFGTSKFFLKPTIWIIPNIVWVFLLVMLIGFLMSLWGKTKKGRRSLNSLSVQQQLDLALERSMTESSKE